MSLNKVLLIGRLTHNPTYKQSRTSKGVATFNLVTNKKSKGKITNVIKHKCIAFNKLADLINMRVTKGTQLYVEGELTWEGEAPECLREPKIVVHEIKILDKRRTGLPDNFGNRAAADYHNQAYDDEWVFPTQPI